MNTCLCLYKLPLDSPVLPVSSCHSLTQMHQQKKGARQPQRSFLPSIRDHHAWQLWGTGLKTGSGSRVSSFKKKKVRPLYPSPKGGHPPLMGGPRHRSKPAVGMDISIAPPILGAVPCVTPSPTNGRVACVCRPRLGASSLHCLCHGSALHAQGSVSPSNAP